MTTTTKDDRALDMGGITVGDDGVMRWVYEVNMWKDTTIPIAFLKVAAVSTAAPALLVFVLELCDGGGLLSALALFARIYAIVGGIILALFLVGYYLFFVPIVHHGGYPLIFEMDEKSVSHIQMPKGAKRSQAVAAVAVLVGTATRSLVTVGSGILAGLRTSMESQFSSVRRITPKPRQNAIYLKSGLSTNIIYVEPDDFDFVLNYIKEHCKKNRTKLKAILCRCG